MKEPQTFIRMLAEYAAQLACLLALGLGAIGLVTWWSVARAPASDTAAFLAALTNPPPPLASAPDLSAPEAALAAGTQPVRVVLSGAHDLFGPSRPEIVARRDER
jgi:hypothetical protein